jgi:hypothetical protein
MKRGQSISQMMTPLFEEKRRLKAKIEALQVETGKIPGMFFSLDEDLVKNYNFMKPKGKIDKFFLDTVNVLYYIVFQTGERGFF